MKKLFSILLLLITVVNAEAQMQPVGNVNQVTQERGGHGSDSAMLTPVRSITAPAIYDGVRKKGRIQTNTDGNFYHNDGTIWRKVYTESDSNALTTSYKNDTMRARINNALAGKQSSLGYTPQNVADKATDFTTVNDTKYPSVKATKDYVDTHSGSGAVTDTVDKSYGILRRELTVGKWPIRKNARMWIFGNSITIGANTTEPFYSYINIVSRDMGVIPLNYARSGSRLFGDSNSTSVLMRRDLPTCTDTNDFVWMSQGTNDITGSASQIGDTTLYIIQLCVAKGYLASHVIINGCFLRVGYGSECTAINVAQRSAATSQGSIFINQDTGMLSVGGYTLLDVDGVHLTTIGHKVDAVICENQMTNNYGFKFPGYSLFNGNIKTFGNAEIGNGINVTGNVDIVGGAITVHPINASTYYNSGFFGPTYFVSTTTSDRGHGGFRITMEQTGRSYTWDYDVFDYKWKAFKDSTRVYSIDTNGSTYTGGSHIENMVNIDAQPYNVLPYRNVVRSRSNANGSITMVLPPSPIVGETHSFQNYVSGGGFPTYDMSFDGNGKVLGDYGTTTYNNVKSKYITWQYDGDQWVVTYSDDRFRDAAWVKNTVVEYRMPFMPYSRTLAQLNALTGIPNGAIAFCSDCLSSTGTTGCNVQFNGTTWEKIVTAP